MAGRSANKLVTRLVAGLAVMTCLCTASAQLAKQDPPGVGIVYRNPRVYNVEYSVELSPDPNTIDRSKDLKLWVPIPREWDSQKAVKIISVQPEPHARYVDPEYGNPMLFWDFGKRPEQTTYTANIRFRLESYEVSVKVDPNRVGSYDKTSKEYALYTGSRRTCCITPKIQELARIAVGEEKNPYLQAKRICEFVQKKVRFKMTFERGIQYLLDNPIKDEQGKEEYYVGDCGQFSALFITMCRAVGIPSRAVNGFVGWRPWAKAEDFKEFHHYETELSPAGLAGARHYVALDPHTWAEFYIPDYGWIPVDATGGVFGRQTNKTLITGKVCDVQIGPFAPQEENAGYGFQWVLIQDGRVDCLQSGVWNIAKIRTAAVRILHHSDPFPADGLASYCENTFVKTDVEKNLRHWRQGVLSWPSRFARSSVPQHSNMDTFYHDYPRAKDDREAFVCHILRRQLGEEQFVKLVDRYIELRQKSNQAVPTSRFRELAEDIYGAPLDWFFNQWVNCRELPRLRLEKVVVKKDQEGWQVQGRLAQSGNTIFRLPIELALDTKKRREKQNLWVEKKAVDFEFDTPEEPQRLTVDPDYEVLKVQRMAPRLQWFWDVDPQLAIVYGTLGETEANKTAAERFTSDYLGSGHGIIKADTDANDADLKSKCVFLIGRPETNRVAQRFKDSFPIKFDGARFAWQGTTYGKPTQGVAQVIESPINGEGLMVMYAGLSPEATLKLCDLELYDSDCSYVIFDGDKQAASGDWEEVDADLSWRSNSHPPLGSPSSQAP